MSLYSSLYHWSWTKFVVVNIVVVDKQEVIMLRLQRIIASQPSPKMRPVDQKS
jgi:hypothetical protein